ncbi:MAG: hypothetical protein ACOZCL_04115 [Bacillota bacterium]
MNLKDSLICPNCKSGSFDLKREATYLYTYKLETPLSEQNTRSEEALPYLFDNREKTCDREYLQCSTCGAKFPCTSDIANGRIHMTIVQKAVRTEHVNNPDFLG